MQDVRSVRNPRHLMRSPRICRRARLIGHLKANPKSKGAGRRQIEALARLRVATPPAGSTPTHDSIRANRKFSRHRRLGFCGIKNTETAAERVENGAKSIRMATDSEEVNVTQEQNATFTSSNVSLVFQTASHISALIPQFNPTYSNGATDLFR